MVNDLVSLFPNNFVSVSKLICNFENIKKTTALTFVEAFKNITHLEIGRRNMGLYRHLISCNMKVRVLKVIFPIVQLVE